MPVTGAVTCSTETKHKKTVAKFDIMEDDSGNFLGYNPAEELHLINVVKSLFKIPAEDLRDGH